MHTILGAYVGVDIDGFPGPPKASKVLFRRVLGSMTL